MIHNQADQEMRARCLLFLISFFIACTPQQNEVISLKWENNKATGILLPSSLLKGRDLQDRLTVQLIQPGERRAILGEIKTEGDIVIFEPLVPFTRGLRYEVLLDNHLLVEIEVPKAESMAPELLAVYPSPDTVPENLLKMYFCFSQPMSEGHSLSFITVTHGSDTLQGTFLDLKPELWNTEGTLLTLWLDPGRVKRDLIPNREMGTPLTAGNTYTISLSSDWKSKEGAPLPKSYSKTFVAGPRDEEIPVASQWIIAPPSSGVKAPLQIDFQESLDYAVVMEAITILDGGDHVVSGTIQLTNEEKSLLLTPTERWESGTYEIRFESRIEDLCGNNLNRPFDRDVSKVQSTDQKIFTRSFSVR